MRVLISESEIRRVVYSLARQIDSDYFAKTPVVLIVLKGAFVFASDLVRAMVTPIEIDFVMLRSYSDTSTTGEVVEVMGLAANIRGRHVIVVEDIVDTGLTLKCLIDKLQMKGPESLRVCVLLSKPSRRKVYPQVDYIGFEIQDEFVVGYGLDHNERYRHYGAIWALEE